MTLDELVVKGIPCMLLRGGTSKGAYFLSGDLPPDPAARDDLLLRVMGSPDPRQIDGVGGAHPLTSKVAIVSTSAEPGIDVDYLYLQVGVDEATVSSAQTCGNLLAGVGPFAIERGLVRADAERTTVRIRLVNTGDVAAVTVSTPGGRVRHTGDVAIDGVPGTAAAIEIEMEHDTGKALLPTGNLIDDLDGRAAKLIDNGMPIVVVEARSLGIVGTESPADLEDRQALKAEVEHLRLLAGPVMGFGDVSALTVPKMLLVSPPKSGGAISTRAFIPARVHTSIGVLMAASVAAAVQIPGTIAHHVSRATSGDTVVIEHPTGSFTASSRVEMDGGRWHSRYSANLRTARKLFDGRVFPRPAAD